MDSVLDMERNKDNEILQDKTVLSTDAPCRQTGIKSSNDTNTLQNKDIHETKADILTEDRHDFINPQLSCYENPCNVTIMPLVKMTEADIKRNTITDGSYLEQRSMRETSWESWGKELPPFKIELLILSNFDISHENENKRISYDRDNNKVILKAATFNDLQELKVAMYECIDNIVYDHKKLSEPRYQLLSRAQCLKSLQLKGAESENIKVRYQCDGKKKEIRCYALTKREARIGVQLLEDEITQLKIHIDASQLQSLQNEDWDRLIESLQADFTSLYESEDKAYIVIDSLKEEEATSFYGVINQYLAANVKITQTSIVLEKSKARCFQSRFQDALRKRIRTSGGTLDIETVSEDPLKINVLLSGLKLEDSTTDELAIIDNQIWQEIIPIDKDLFKDDVNMVLKGLTKPYGKDFMYSFEHTYHCFIDVDIIKEPEVVSACDSAKDASFVDKEDWKDDVGYKIESNNKTYRSPNKKSGSVNRKRNKKRESKFHYYQGNMSEYEAIQMSLLQSRQRVKTVDNGNCLPKVVSNIKTEDWEMSKSGAEISPTFVKDVCCTCHFSFKYHDDNRKLFHTDCKVESNDNRKLFHTNCKVEGNDKHVICESKLEPQPQPKTEEKEGGNRSDDNSEVGGKTTTWSIYKTKVHLVLGQVVKQEADVLVNILSSNENPFGETVPSSFLEAGGQLLQKLYTDIDSVLSGPIVVTSSTGQLVHNCSAVFHVKVMKGFQMKQMMSSIISKILTECINWNSQSIALPPLCTDTASYEVAASMLTELNKSLKSENSKLKDIYLNVDDDKTFSVFEDASKTFSYSHVGNTTVKSLQCRSKQNEMRMIQKFEHTCIQEITQTAQSCSTIIVTAENKTICIQAKEMLKSRLKEEFLHEEIIEKKENLHAITTEKIMTITNANDVKFTEEESYFLLRGHQGTVRKVYTDIQKAVLKEKRNTKKVKGEIKRDTREFVISMLDCEPETPSYWKCYKQGKRLTSLLISTKNLFTHHKFLLEELRKTSHAFSTIVGMINETFDERLLGKGNDAYGLRDYRKLFVLKIERIENLDLYEQFFRKRQTLYRRLYKAGEMTFPKLEDQRKCSGSILTASHVHPALDQDVHSGINEYLLFHGTKSENVTTICNEGFEPRISDNGSMYGPGIYAAECATKADQYADDRRRRSIGRGNTKNMFLIRMVLGNCFVSSHKNPKKYRKPPCTTCLQDDCCDTGHNNKFGRFYDSVVGDNGRLFREFIVYESCLCYPEYLITYERR